MSDYIFELSHKSTSAKIRLRMYVVWGVGDDDDSMVVRWEEVPHGTPSLKLMLEGGVVYWNPKTGDWTFCKDVLSKNYVLKIDAPRYIGLDELTGAYHGPVSGKLQLNLDASTKHKLPTAGWEWRFIEK